VFVVEWPRLIVNEGQMRVNDFGLLAHFVPELRQAGLDKLVTMKYKLEINQKLRSF